MQQIKIIYNTMFDLFNRNLQNCAKEYAQKWINTKYAEFADDMSDAVEETSYVNREYAKNAFVVTWNEIKEAEKTLNLGL